MEGANQNVGETEGANKNAGETEGANHQNTDKKHGVGDGEHLCFIHVS